MCNDDGISAYFRRPVRTLDEYLQQITERRREEQAKSRSDDGHGRLSRQTGSVSARRRAEMTDGNSRRTRTQQTITLESLPSMTNEELRAAWSRITGKPRLKTQSHEFLVMAVAWELQAKQFGGLKPAVRRKLETLAAALQGGAAVTQHDRRPRYRPGTVVTKQWHGTNHTITVLENGYAYQGTVYKSLSEIARVITGTRWNGPKFFGLRAVKDRTRSDG